MIGAADKVLPLVDNNTKIVPGHGPLGNKADLTKFRDMLVVVRDRVQKLKTADASIDIPNRAHNPKGFVGQYRGDDFRDIFRPADTAE
jgi:hypothetical protein